MDIGLEPRQRQQRQDLARAQTILPGLFLLCLTLASCREPRLFEGAFSRADSQSQTRGSIRSYGPVPTRLLRSQLREDHRDAEANVLELVRDHLAVPPSKKLSLATHLVRDLGANTLDVTEFAMELEDHNGIIIPKKELDAICDLRKAVELVRQRIDERAATIERLYGQLRGMVRSGQPLTPRTLDKTTRPHRLTDTFGRRRGNAWIRWRGKS